MADFTALKTAIQTYIKQNGNEEINGEKLQEILLSVVTTLGDSAINDLITALADEVAARQNADGTLQQNINNEATARGNADTALGGRIDDEATARANGDTALSNRLGSTITAENTAADQIGAEAEARADADTALQELIDGITNNIENGYVYAGIATPSGTPATGKVFYLALTAGTYTNFGNTEVSQGINILKYNGTAWSLDAFIGIDDELTPGSNNIPKSGNVLENIIKNGSAFDLSAYNAVDGILATYADLDAALAALNLLPAVYKQGGMSFRFVCTSDNKYVQARCMAQNFTADITQWQTVDAEVTKDSHNLIESGAVDKAVYKLNKDIHGEKFITPTQVEDGYLSSTGSFTDDNNYHHVIADVSRLIGKNLTISGYYVQWGFLKTYNVPNDSEWATGGRIDVSTKDCINEEIPSDANYIYVYLSESTTIPSFTVTPLQDGIDGEIEEINSNLDAIGERIDRVDDRIDGIDETIGTINEKIGRLDSSQLCKVQYFQGTFGTASEKLSIYIPCGEGIIRYDLTHNITTNKMKDVWRIQYAYLIVGSTETPITINGEWECAFLINGQNDATGGDLHGYEEIQGDLSVFVDGMLKSASSLSDGKYFNELRIVEATYMYKQDATKVAEHGREYTFSIEGILLRQTLKFVENLLLDNCYMMMLPAAKSLTNKYYTDVDFVVNNIASLPIYKDGVKSFSILGDNFKANIIAQDYPEFPTTLLIHDNGGGSYNKCYFIAAYNKNVSANTKFESSVLYQIAAAQVSQETHYADYYPLTQGQTVASNGQPTSSDTYDLVTIILERPARLWTNWNSSLSYTAIGYNGVRYRSSENNLPSSSNPLVVQANTPVYFSCLPQIMDESEIVIQYT